MIAEVKKKEEDKDEYSNLINESSKNRKRLDLNNLLVRLRKTEKHDKSVKTIIFLALSVICVSLILLALNVTQKLP